jgi:imidazolonepropionase-like amidohydrolase
MCSGATAFWWRTIRSTLLYPWAVWTAIRDIGWDTSGATLMPGLMDCHVHLIFGCEPDIEAGLAKLSPGQIVMRCLENAQAALKGGITSLRDLGGLDGLELAVRDAVNSGRQTGPLIQAAGSFICMTGGHGHRHGRVADGPAEVVKAVREQVAKGVDVIKLMATGGVTTPGVDPRLAHYTESELSAGITEGRRFGKPSAAHAQATAGILNAVRAGIDSVEHGVYLDDECIEAMLERGTFLVPTLSVPVNVLDNADQGIPAFIIEKTEMVTERHRESVRRYYEAGGKLAMGTDAGLPFNVYGDNAQELAHLVDAGIRPVDALVMGTGNAAALLRLANRGTIRTGAMADLLVVSGDPTQEIAMAADPANHRMVVKEGRVVYRKPLRDRLHEHRNNP